MTRLFPLLFIAVALSLSALSGNARAQDTENSLLPEIDPQDIEIRSQFKARFPGLRRQPILGFDPTPRVYRVDPDREPFMETQEQVVASLPVSELSRPAAPQYTPLLYSEDIRAFARGGYGSYQTPVAQFWGVQRLSENQYVGGDLNFSSSGGHLESQPSSFRFMDANAEFGTKLDRQTRLNLNLNGQSDFHYLPRLENPPSSGLEYGKNYFGMGFDGEIKRRKNSFAGWTIDAEIEYFDIKFDDPNVSEYINETVYRGSFNKYWPGSRVNETYHITADAQTGVSGPDDNQEGWTTLQAGAQYNRLFNYSTKLIAEASVYYTTSAFETTTYIGPRLVLEHSLDDRLILTGSLSGKPYLQTLETHHETNRFLTGPTPLRHSYEMKAGASASYKYYEGSTVDARISYSRTSDLPVYVQQVRTNVIGEPIAIFYDVIYRDASNLRLEAGITHQLLPERFWVSARAYVQNPTLDNGNRIPFRENAGLQGSLSARFLKTISIEAWADYVGGRKTGVGGETLDGFLLLGSQIDVKISERFGAYLKGVNLLDQDYELWRGYTERPRQVFGGITLRLK